MITIFAPAGIAEIVPDTDLAAVILAVVPVASAIADAPQIAAMKAGYARPATIPFPADNPYTDQKAELGKMLFFDTRLSTCPSLTPPSALGVTEARAWHTAYKSTVVSSRRR